MQLLGALHFLRTQWNTEWEGFGFLTSLLDWPLAGSFRSNISVTYFNDCRMFSNFIWWKTLAFSFTDGETKVEWRIECVWVSPSGWASDTGQSKKSLRYWQHGKHFFPQDWNTPSRYVITKADGKEGLLPALGQLPRGPHAADAPSCSYLPGKDTQDSKHFVSTFMLDSSFLIKLISEQWKHFKHLEIFKKRIVTIYVFITVLQLLSTFCHPRWKRIFLISCFPPFLWKCMFSTTAEICPGVSMLECHFYSSRTLLLIPASTLFTLPHRSSLHLFKGPHRELWKAGATGGPPLFWVLFLLSEGSLGPCPQLSF